MVALGCDHGQTRLLAHGDLDLALLDQEGHMEHVPNAGPTAGGVQHKLEVVDGASAHLPELGDEASEHVYHLLLCLVLRLLHLRQHGGSCLLEVRHLGCLPGLGVLGLLLGWGRGGVEHPVHAGQEGGPLKEHLGLLSEHDPLPPDEVLPSFPPHAGNHTLRLPLVPELGDAGAHLLPAQP